MKIFCIFSTVNISILNFLLVICIAKNLIWTILKAIFSVFLIFGPSDSRYSNSCISAKYYPILTNHTSMESLLSFQVMYKSQFNFEKIDTHDRFCGPGSQLMILIDTLDAMRHDKSPTENCCRVLFMTY